MKYGNSVLDEVIRKWLIGLTSDFYINDRKINTLLFADNECNIQRDI
jgi:hypothetical protein